MDNNWKYKIGSGKTPVILMLAMSALFCGLTLWLYNTNNRAVIFSGILTAVMMLVLILTIYRLIFYKVLIGAYGFYYQTNIVNGKYYAYTDVKKAWISSGTAGNGGQEQYCNIALYSEKVIRFPFFYNDEKSVNYFVKRANAETQKINAVAVTKKDEYRIDGKAFGKTKIIFGIAILAMLAFMDIFIIREIGFIFIIIPSIAMGIVTAWIMFNYYLFFQVKIDKDGFYCRTSPFNGKYYKYNEIASCREIKRVIRHYHHGNGSTHRMYYFYFEFADVKGKKHKFQFEQQIHEHEIHMLKERIEMAQGQKAG